MAEIKTKEFTLRHIKMSDAKPYLESMQDKQAKKGLMATPKNIAEAKKEIKEMIKKMNIKKPTGETFVIEVNGEYAGYIGLHDLNKKYQEFKGEIGYCIHPEYRGKGLATRATKLIIKYGFDKLKLKRISGTCRTFNKASAKVLEKSGFKLEGILKKNKCKKGKYMDDMLWAITK